MCGRYAATANPDDLIEEFEIDADRTGERTRSLLKSPQDPAPGAPDHNMAPTKQAPVVLTRAPKEEPGDPLRQLRLLSWGLVPSWARDTKVGPRMTNARAETLLDKSSFARAAAVRRCLVPAAGWYEWQASPVATDSKGKPRKQPFFIHRGDGDLLAFAGLYEFWRDRALPEEDPGAWLVTFTIVTTTAEPGLDRIHDRQPLVLERGDHARWLDPDLTDPQGITDLLAFEQPGRFAAHPISTAVNATRNNGPELLTPLPAEDLVGVVDPETGEVVGS
ncbi:SOS response-associated peptidase [Janibacter sp. GS2]|uniref:SOS response-associated peptidase n=1 Tax=Janibacter sp. GS2 TaxID=3442646 RepID=UPI003EB84232